MSNDDFSLQVPILHSTQAEESIVGALMIDPDVYYTIKGRVSEDDFHSQMLRKVFTTIERLLLGKVTPDFVTITEALDAKGWLKEDEVTPAYLSQLVSGTPSTLNAEHYCDIVRDFSRRRAVLRTANELAKVAYDRENDLDEAIASPISQLFEHNAPRRGAVPFRVFLEQAYDLIMQRAENPVDIWGWKTGFTDIDYLMGGMVGGEVWDISGEPGVGKSILGVQIIMQTSSKEFGGNAAAIYALEMSGIAVAMRQMSAHSEINARKLKTGKIVDADYSVLTNTVENLWDRPVYLCEQAGITLSEFRADLMRLKQRMGLRVVLLDYAYLMGGVSSKNPIERTEIISREIKVIARDTGTHIIEIQSVTKEGFEAKSASNKNMRGSGQVAHDGDFVSFLVKGDDPAMPNLRLLSYTKTRDVEGEKKTVPLYKNDGFPSFRELNYRTVPAEDMKKKMDIAPWLTD